METITLKVSGMTCPHCQRNVERNVSKIEGISKVSVQLENGEVTIEGEGLNLTEITQVIEKIGYKVV